ncbi:MAG: DUF1570 domain-containing protein [Planctomycetes bacterium]|nr:DUF1570 domain-containing protein [Planctomycetota bacterium]
MFCRPSHLATAILATTVAAQAPPPRDVVVLANGAEQRGRIVRVDDEVVVLRTGSTEREIPRHKVQSFTSVAARHRDLIAAFQTTPTDEPAALQALAARADEQDLPHEARLCRWYALLLRPDDAALHTALGNREQNGRWCVPIDGSWLPFVSAREPRADFDDAWQLRSEHFALRTTAGLRTGLDTLFELEALYWQIHARFGADLALLELVEPVDVRLYGTRDQMPNLADTVAAYFSTAEPALFTCVEHGRPVALFHEGTHALLHHFFVRAAKGRGQLPSWLDEGWADYMDGLAQTRVPGKPVFRDQSVQPAHLQALAAARAAGDLYGVHRLLNLQSSDFQASTRQDTKYAQAWALFRHLREHADAALRTTFVDYLQAAARGKGQASTFRRLFAAHERRLETEPWQ